MKPEYLDTSDAASKKAIDTVVQILKTSKVKMERESSFISVLEPVMPAAIKALYKSGFHRTTSPAIFMCGSLALRRLNVLVEVGLPSLKYGADVNRQRKKTELQLVPISLSKEGVRAKTKEDSLIDISYARIEAIYKETEDLNAWRNHMEFVLPEDRQIAAFIGLLDRAIGERQSGSAVHYDRFKVRWGNSPGLVRRAQLDYRPTSELYELEVKIDAFSWGCAGRDFNYPDTAADLARSVKRHLETCGDTSQYQWLMDFHKRIMGHLNDSSSSYYEEVKQLAGKA